MNRPKLQEFRDSVESELELEKKKMMLVTFLIR